MPRLFLVLAIVCSVSCTCMSCFFQETKQDEPEVHVIHLDEDSSESGAPKVLTFEIPDYRRRRDTEPNIRRTVCKHDGECNPGEVCIPHVACVSGRRVVRRSPMDTITRQLRTKPPSKRRKY